MADERGVEKKEQKNEHSVESVPENPPKPNPVARQESAEEVLKDVEEEDRFQATDN